MRVLTLLWLMLALVAPASARDNGRRVALGAVASARIAPAQVTVWLPPGYARGKRPYGVLYMHDGQNLFDPAATPGGKSWQVDRAVARLIAARRIEPVIVVAIAHLGRDRVRQYLPAEPIDAIPPLRDGMASRIGGKVISDAYLRFLVEELKPRIDRDYRTRPGKADTAIAGASMGGLISLYAIARHPEIFGRAAALSTHWPVTMPDGETPLAMRAPITAMWTGWLGRRLGAPDGRRIWFDHGDQGLDRWYAPYQQAVDAQLVALGWRANRDFVSRAYPGADHNEAAWAARLEEVLAWLLAKSPEN